MFCSTLVALVSVISALCSRILRSLRGWVIMGTPWQFALNKTPPAMPNLAFTICHLVSFPLGFRSPRVIFIYTPSGQGSSVCWSKLEPCAAPPRGNSRFGFSCMERSSESALRTRYVQLLSGFIGTFGRCCWTCFTIVEDVL